MTFDGAIFCGANSALDGGSLPEMKNVKKLKLRRGHFEKEGVILLTKMSSIQIMSVIHMCMLFRLYCPLFRSNTRPFWV